MPEDGLNKRISNTETASNSLGNRKESPEATSAPPSQENPEKSERAPEEIATEIQKLDKKIEIERAALNAARQSLGLPPARTSVAIEYLEDRRADLTKEGVAEKLNINPAIAHYFTRFLESWKPSKDSIFSKNMEADVS